MSKKRKKTTGNDNNSEAVLSQIGTTAGFGKKSTEVAEMKPEAKAREAMRTTLAGKFRAFHFIVEANEQLLKKPYYTLEVDADGKHTSESFGVLKEQAEKILSCNFQPYGSKRDDLTWAEARWSRESGLDPHLPFEVGLCVSRKPNVQRQAKTLAIISCSEKIGGLGLEPDQEGRHLDVPGAGILFTRDLVLVTRSGHHLATCSIMEALQGSNRAEWRKELPQEAESRRAEAAVLQAQREQSAKADAAADMFLQSLRRRELEEEKEAQAEAQARWEDRVVQNHQLSEEWDRLINDLNGPWSEAQDDVNMVLGLVRPGNPQAEAVERFTGLYRDQVAIFAGWIRDTYAGRQKMKPHECVALLRDEVDGLVDEDWFTADGTPIPSLKGLDEYGSLGELEAAVDTFPGASPKAADMVNKIRFYLKEEGEQKTPG